MSSILRNAAAIAAVACIGGAALSGAQAQTTGTSGTSSTIGTSGTVGAGNLQAAGETVTLPTSSEGQVAAADKIVANAVALSQRVAQMLDDARRDADVIRVTCLNDKLTQINANLRTAQSRYGALQRTVDGDQRKHELTVLTVLGTKLGVLDQEANQCVGQDLYETGPTQVTTEINTSLLPFEDQPTTPENQTPTAPTTLGVQDASITGANSE